MLRRLFGKRDTTRADATQAGTCVGPSDGRAGHPLVTSEEVTTGTAARKLREIALQGSSDLRLQAIRELGHVATSSAADDLLAVTKEWSHQKELADNPAAAVGEEASFLMLSRGAADAYRRPGQDLSFEEGRASLRKALADAKSSVTANPPRDPGGVPADAIAAALAEIGSPAIEAMDRWLSISVHPAIADVVIRAAQKIGGPEGVSVLERLSRAWVDPKTAEVAKQAAERIKRDRARFR